MSGWIAIGIVWALGSALCLRWLYVVAYDRGEREGRLSEINRRRWRRRKSMLRVVGGGDDHAA